MPTTRQTIAAAYAECERRAREHYENFPVASLLLPKEKRRHVAAFYAFARQADDFADEPEHEGRRLERLAAWRRQLEEAASGRAADPVFIAIAETLRSAPVPVRLLHDLISAFEQDVRVSWYESFDDLLAYCRLSANPVGRLLLHLFGHTGDRFMQQSDAICTALQLTNFWQDVALDRDKGRCYIPREDQRRFGCGEEAIRDGVVTPAFTDLMRFQVDRTRAIFDRGAGLPADVGGRLGFELRLVLLGGRRILDKIEQAGFDVFRGRPVLRRTDWGRMMLRAALPGGAANAPAASAAPVEGTTDGPDPARRRTGGKG